MPLERPKPLFPALEPKATLRAMLEASDRKDRGEDYPSPLIEVDFMSLDELLNRIDTGALALNQVPEPEDIEKLVGIYWSMREKFVEEQRQGIISRPRKKPSASVPTIIANPDAL